MLQHPPGAPESQPPAGTPGLADLGHVDYSAHLEQLRGGTHLKYRDPSTHWGCSTHVGVNTHPESLGCGTSLEQAGHLGDTPYLEHLYGFTCSIRVSTPARAELQPHLQQLGSQHSPGAPGLKFPLRVSGLWFSPRLFSL